MTVVLLDSASSSPWSRPGDWNDTGHTVNLVGCGGDGGNGTGNTSTYRSGAGGGGGGHVLLTRTAGALGSTVNFRIAVSNTSQSNRTTDATCWGSDTFANCRYVESGEKGDNGNSGTAGGTGGNATTTTQGTPTVPTYSASQNNNGGNGGATGSVTGSASGGGGAGGPTGAGANGGPCSTASRGGGGGGGANGGATGGGTSGSATGANGGNGPGGTGGGAGSGSGSGTAGTTNTGGGGGGGFFTATSGTCTGGAGGDDDIWTQTSDSATEGPGGGGGGGGASSQNGGSHNGNGGVGGKYGGGAGGTAGRRASSTNNNGVAGASGLIVITYSAAAVHDVDRTESAAIAGDPVISTFVAGPSHVESVAIADVPLGKKYDASGDVIDDFPSFTIVNANWQGTTMRVVLSPNLLNTTISGAISVKFEFGAASNGSIANCFIGHNSSGDEYDFDSAPTRLTFDAGNNGKAISGAMSVETDAVSFTYDATKKLVVSISFTGTRIDLLGYGV